MRFALVLPLLATLAVAAPGCDYGCVKGNGDSCSGPWDAPLPDMAMMACPGSCLGGCGTDGSCMVPDGVTQDRAFCASTCTDDRDCAKNARCITLFAAMLPSVCIVDSTAIGCYGASGGVCDTPPTCDGDVANVSFSDSARGICGWERVHCANGCSNGACN